MIFFHDCIYKNSEFKSAKVLTEAGPLYGYCSYAGGVCVCICMWGGGTAEIQCSFSSLTAWGYRL